MEINKDNALKILENAVAQINTTRANHELFLTALKFLKENTIVQDKQSTQNKVAVAK